MTDTGTVKYLIKTRTDEFMIEIARKWKITFAAVNPASSAGVRGDGYCVRVYEMPGSALRAVFDSVLSIRDISIPLARKIKSEIGHSKWERDSQGNFSEAREVKVDAQFLLETEL